MEDLDDLNVDDEGFISQSSAQISVLKLLPAELDKLKEKGSTHIVTCGVAVGEVQKWVYDTRTIQILTPSMYFTFDIIQQTLSVVYFIF